MEGCTLQRPTGEDGMILEAPSIDRLHFAASDMLLCLSRSALRCLRQLYSRVGLIPLFTTSNNSAPVLVALPLPPLLWN